MSEVVKQEAGDVLEQVVIGGDLARLTPGDRVRYYKAVCDSLGLNWLTQPFQYVVLNGKLTLYANKNCAEQIRERKGASTNIISRERADDLYVVTARATEPGGRTEESIGAVFIGGLKGEQLANALMKAETKSKRRATFALFGMGWLDETEVESIATAKTVNVTVAGEIVAEANVEAPAPWVADAKLLQRMWIWAGEQGLSHDEVHKALGVQSVKDYMGTRDEAKAAILAYVNAQSERVTA